MDTASRGLRLRIWRGEESAIYSSVLMGSSAAFGKFNTDSLQRVFKGATLEQAILSQGINVDYIRTHTPTISQHEIDQIHAHIELHIEQANSLERNNTRIGIVTGIRGPYRMRVTLRGEFDHSGATPMGPHYRRDANLTLGYLIVELDKLAAKAQVEGNDIVQTIGVINSDESYNQTRRDVYQNGTTKVSGFCYFTIDVRSTDLEFRSTYIDSALRTINEICLYNNVEHAVEHLGSTAPIKTLDTSLHTSLIKSCQSLGISHQLMASGATHDCAMVAQQLRSDKSPIPVGLIFIPCQDGKSHCPEEFASFEDIACGTSVLATTFYSLTR